MQTATQIKELLASRGLSPRKSLGQNFLIDHNLIRRLVEASGVGAGDVVLEVGPGTGTLTEELLARGCAVVACELDHGLAALLRERLAAHAAAGRFTLVEGDCLASKRALSPDVVAALGGRAFRLVANLPYGAASPLMLALLCEHPACGSMHVTIQREVADRLLAAPGTEHYGTLGVVAQAVAGVTRVAALPPECFWPRPEVTSAMVSIARRAAPLTDDTRRLAEFCTRVFGARRKQLGTILGRKTPLPPGIGPGQRAEDLNVEQLIALSRVPV
ncbi:MAG: 16S rRNA (adenine(1518)-N(6)/adenine(1519)-N(6))-dimethyltransferase RsmA [Phycisphaerales bacterium]